MARKPSLALRLKSHDQLTVQASKSMKTIIDNVVTWDNLHDKVLVEKVRIVAI